MTRFSLLALLAVIILALAFAGCGGGGGGGTPGGGLEPPPVIDDGNGDPGGDGGVPDDPFTVRFITGKIANYSTGLGVKNVKVIFTNKANLAGTYSATSKDDGSFQIALNGASVLSLFDLPAVFTVDTTLVKAAYPTTSKVSYGGVDYEPNAIPVPIDVLQMEIGALGTIYVRPAVAGGGAGDPGDPPARP